MSVKTETLLVRKIMKMLTQDYQFDGYHVHGSLLQRSGEPDIDGSVMTEFGWLHLKIEVKTSTGKPSVLQIHRLREYYRRGYAVAIVTRYEDVSRLIEAHELFLLNQYRVPFVNIAKIFGLDDPYNLYGETE